MAHIGMTYMNIIFITIISYCKSEYILFKISKHRFKHYRGNNMFILFMMILKDLCCMAHVGMNRFPNMAYFFMYCGCHIEVYEGHVSQWDNMDPGTRKGVW